MALKELKMELKRQMHTQRNWRAVGDGSQLGDDEK